MANEGFSGYGTTLKFSDGTSTTTVAQLTRVGLGAGGITDIDISTMDSTDKFRDFVSGMKDAGEFNFEGMLTGALVEDVLAIVGDKGTWTMQFNDATAPTSGSKAVCAGYLRPFGWDNPFDGPVTITATIKLSGAVGFTAKS